MAQDVELQFPSGVPRLLVGLMWEPNEGQARGVSHDDIPTAHNLDLSCAVLSRDLKVLDILTPRDPKRAKYGEQIFHVGDNLTGGSDYEDEHIRVDFEKLEEEYASLAFIVSAKDGLDIAQARDAACAFSDATSLHPFLTLDIASISAALPGGEVEGEHEHVLAGVVTQVFPGEWSIVNVQARLDALTPSAVERAVRENCL